eukprot:CAMPEP_0113461772 /NCGR_PEP_ID=MMETSP0014_2-20120614/11722_1 /TAXON_ID=2857 /ORGANISM="Nitzschia sp." /LENGTH=515 /DNA_ID=CAMNT_0000353561 /DNA_START=340 /DNA_END=1887 /DNA_ORIENTATION=+ /assembly_acc=CAM_ASM_000159
MSSKLLPKKLPVVTVFTSIANIGPALTETKICIRTTTTNTTPTTSSSKGKDGVEDVDVEKVFPLPVDIIVDEALTGSGGTVEFDPTKLDEKTKSKLATAEILVTEPHVLAKLMELSDNNNNNDKNNDNNNNNDNLLKNLQWCQSTYAGVDPVFKYLMNDRKKRCNHTEESKIAKTDEMKHTHAPPRRPHPYQHPSFTLTRFAGVFGRPIAEFCVGRIIEHERGFACLHEAQIEKQWASSSSTSSSRRNNNNKYKYKYDPSILNYRYLCDLTLTVLGCGDIGRSIARSVNRGFQMKTIGWMRKQSMTKEEDKKWNTRKQSLDCDDDDGGDDNVFHQCTSDLVKAIAKSDYVVSVLPSTTETYHMLTHQLFVDAYRLRTELGGGGGGGGGGKRTKPSIDDRPRLRPPVFINVGRGDVIENSVLLKCLDEDLLEHAILDVVEDEPLPQESPLWSHPRITISPHVSGLTRSSDVPRLIKEQYELFIEEGGGSGSVESNNPTAAATTKDLKYKVDWDKGY